MWSFRWAGDAQRTAGAALTDNDADDRYAQSHHVAQILRDGLTLTALPLMIVYFAFSKYIIAGVAVGGVKE
jgi:ABC-type glycerol-3-phosphate transport system permease component